MAIDFFQSVYLYFFTVTGSYGVALLLLSLSVSIVLMPLQKIADFFKAKDEAEKAVFADELAIYKKHYSGMERHYYISTLYKIHRYHPIKSLRTVLGLLVQLPFFILAFYFLSEFQGYAGASFLFLKDLTKPDGLLWGINLMPILMTALTVASAFIKPASSRRETINLCLLAVLFLALLYSSPSGLVLYWTTSMLFTLLKTLITSRTALQRNSFAAIKHYYLYAINEPFTAAAVFATLLFIGASLPLQALQLIPAKGEIKSDAIMLFALIASCFPAAYFAWFSVVNIKNSNIKIAITSAFGAFLGAQAIMSAFILILLRAGNVAPTLFIGNVQFGVFRLRALSLVFLFTTIAINYAIAKRDFFSVAFKVIFGAKNTSSKLTAPLISAWLTVSFLFVLVPAIRVIASSPQEFSERGELLLWVFATFFVCLAIFSSLSFLLKGVLKQIFLVCAVFLLIYGFVNYFVFAGDYGQMDFFIFHKIDNLTVTSLAIARDIGALALILALSCCLIRFLSFSFLHRLNITVFGMLLLFVMPSLFTLIRAAHKTQLNNEIAASGNVPLQVGETLAPKYFFSKKGKNVLIVFYDRFIGGFVPDALKDVPALKKSLDGFVWYPNTLSFATNTALGLPAVYGGYAYTDVAKARSEKLGDVDWIQKLQPRIYSSTKFMIQKFLDAGYDTFINDPSLLGGPWGGTPSMVRSWGARSGSDNLIGAYNKLIFRKEAKSIAKSNVQSYSAYKIFKNYIIPFSLFKVISPVVRTYIYQNGIWWSHGSSTEGWIKLYIDNLSLAQAWPHISAVSNNPNGSYLFATNKMTHDVYAARDNGAFSSASEEWQELARADISKEALARFGDEISAVHFYGDKEALIRASAWCDWMKENGVYDNTLIIIVSDHGHAVQDPMFLAQKSKYASYHPVLMIKDFNARGNLQIDNRFMTHADVPSFALSAIDPDARQKYGYDKSKGFRVYTSKGNLTVYENIFDLKNWIYKEE